MVEKGPIELVAGPDELVLHSGAGRFREAGLELHRYLRAARVAALTIDADTGPAALGQLLRFLCSCLDQPGRSPGDLETALWDVDMPGIGLRFRATSDRLDPAGASIDLASLFPSNRDGTASYRSLVEREFNANLPLQLARQVLEELRPVADIDEEPAARFRRSAVQTLESIQRLVIERHDVATLDWLLDEFDRHPAISSEDRAVLDESWQTATTPTWFERCLDDATPVRQQCLTCLLIRMSTEDAGRLVAELAWDPDRFPILQTVAATLGGSAS